MKGHPMISKGNLIPIFLCVTFALQISNAGWYRQNSAIGGNLNKVVAIDENNVWACGRAALALKTTDGGSSWNSINVGLGNSYYDISFPTADIGFITSDVGLLQTTNGGTTWQVQSTSSLDEITFLTSTMGWSCGVVGSATALRSTTDGGLTWGQVFSRNGTGVYEPPFFVLDSLRIWVYGGGNKLFRTTNAGLTWDSSMTTSGQWGSICFVDSSTGWLSGGWSYMNSYSCFAKTTNGGVTWTDISFPSAGYLFSTWFASEEAGWVADNYGNIFATSDGGQNWYIQFSTHNTALESLGFIDGDTGWAVGGGGEIVKTTDGGVTSVPSTSEIPVAFSLFQNYPNPFNPTTTIKFQIAHSGLVTLKVFDVLGREVATVVNQEMKPGTYEKRFDGNGLASGVYLYRLATGDFMDTKKFMLIK
jgi:photosystem II stability/assembly factor-like uncharacterized protein